MIDITNDRNESQMSEIDEVIMRDAMRYRWLKSRHHLELRTDGSIWYTESGEKFVNSHYLAANHTLHTAKSNLDDAIDAAMKLDI